MSGITTIPAEDNIRPTDNNDPVHYLIIIMSRKNVYHSV